jgi:hypothetical protein
LNRHFVESRRHHIRRDGHNLSRQRSIFRLWIGRKSYFNGITGNGWSERSKDWLLLVLLRLLQGSVIEHYFEFVTNAWVNNPNFPDSDSGHEP